KCRAQRGNNPDCAEFEMNQLTGERDQTASGECQQHSNAAQPGSSMLASNYGICVNPDRGRVLHGNGNSYCALGDGVVIEEIRATYSENAHGGAHVQSAAVDSQYS